MRRERYGLASASSGLEFNGRFFAVRLSHFTGGVVTLRIDNGGGMGLPIDVDAPSFLPTMEADVPASRIKVTGGTSCLVEVAETLQEALFLVAMPPVDPDPYVGDDVTYENQYAAAMSFVTTPWTLPDLRRPSWVTGLEIWTEYWGGWGTPPAAHLYRVSEAAGLIGGAEMPYGDAQSFSGGSGQLRCVAMFGRVSSFTGQAAPAFVVSAPPPNLMRVKFDVGLTNAVAYLRVITRFFRA